MSDFLEIHKQVNVAGPDGWEMRRKLNRRFYFERDISCPVNVRRCNSLGRVTVANAGVTVGQHVFKKISVPSGPVRFTYDTSNLAHISTVSL